jgi:hypothetical protein
MTLAQYGMLKMKTILIAMLLAFGHGRGRADHVLRRSISRGGGENLRQELGELKKTGRAYR